MSQLTEAFNARLKDPNFTPSRQVVFLYARLEDPLSSPSDKRWINKKLRAIRNN